MRVLILGATGRTGKWVLQKALEKEYSDRVLVRDSTYLDQRASYSF